MDVETVKLLSLYNKTANAKMNQCIEKLSNEQWEAKFNCFYPTMRALCNHIYTSDINWLKRFGTLRPFEYTKNDVFKKEIKFGEIIIGDIADYLKLRAELDAVIEQFANELTPADMGKRLVYKDPHGNDHDNPYGGLILHLFNHETHHRGMVSVYLEQLGIANDYSSLSAVL